MTNDSSFAVAREHFDAMRLGDAYLHFKPAFERVAAGVEPDHVEYLGDFVRCTILLGRRRELTPLARRIEGHHARRASAATSFSLALLLQSLCEPRWEESKALCENGLALPDAREFSSRLKMLIAYYHERIEEDLGSCRRLLFHLDESREPVNRRGVLLIWKALILSSECSFGQAREALGPLLGKVPPEIHWYLYLSSRVVLANLLIRESKRDEAREVVRRLGEFFKGDCFTLVESQMVALENILSEKSKTESARRARGRRGGPVVPDHSVACDALGIAQLVETGLLDQRTLVKNLL